MGTKVRIHLVRFQLHRCCFAYLFLPETRDRTLEEIHEMFENKVPARKFKTYVCVGVEAYAAAAGKESVQHAIDEGETLSGAGLGKQ